MRLLPVPAQWQFVLSCRNNASQQCSYDSEDQARPRHFFKDVTNAGYACPKVYKCRDDKEPCFHRPIVRQLRVVLYNQSMNTAIKNKSAYLFDMDGTLVNTEPVGPQVFEALFTSYGVKLSDDEKELFVKVWRRDGTDIKEDAYLESLRQKYTVDVVPTAFLQEFFDRYKKAIISADALPGADMFIRQAHGAGMKLAVVTSSKRDQVIAVLDFHGWSESFDLLVAEEDITKFKPDPEPYLTAAQKLNIDPDRCIVFEDAENGAIAGKAAGMFVVGLRAGNEIEQDLVAANIVVGSFAELLSQNTSKKLNVHPLQDSPMFKSYQAMKKTVSVPKKNLKDK